MVCRGKMKNDSGYKLVNLAECEKSIYWLEKYREKQ